MPSPPSRPLLLFVVTEDWYFHSHRLPTARAALAAGFDVALATRVDKHADAITREGIRLIPLDWRRRSLNPLRAVADTLRLARIYRREKPALIHHVALKPAIIGGLAALLAGLGVARRPAIVTTLAGLGLVFSGAGPKSGLARVILKLVLRATAMGRRAALVVQNRDDEALLQQGWPAPPPALLVPGSGVDLDRFAPLPPPVQGAGPLVCAQVSRMLTLKGVEDVVDAVRRLRADGHDVRLLLAGAADDGSRAAIPQATLENWSTQPGITWLGPVSDVRAVWARADIAILASRGGEGIPMSLMEAAACGRPIIATDVPGNREVARPGVNALLVPPGNPMALANAIDSLRADGALRQALAAASRGVVDPDLGAAAIARRMQDLYTGLVSPPIPPPTSREERRP